MNRDCAGSEYQPVRASTAQGSGRWHGIGRNWGWRGAYWMGMHVRFETGGRERRALRNAPSWAPSVRRAAAVVGAAAACSLFAGSALAQDDPPRNELQEALDRRADSTRLQERAVAAFEAGDVDAAIALLQEQLALEPANALAMYNLACVRCVNGEREESLELLKSAIEHGFVDFEQMRRDPNLVDLRETDLFQQILAQRTPILDAAGNAHFEGVQGKYGRKYVYDVDDALKVNFASAYDQTTLDAAKVELRQITDWALEELFTDLNEPPMRKVDPWVVVVLPSERDFRAWAIATHGPASVTSEFSRIGGAYNHNRKELVAMDLGGTLRHEFLHVLHWRSNMRLAQGHPVWIQEGLCSLVEDYDMRRGKLVPVASWRTNTVINQNRGRRVMDIAELAKMDRHTFNNRQPLANYAVARAVFLYLYQRGMLSEWYQHYTANYLEDPSGVAAIEAVLGKPIDEVQDDFEDWIGGLDRVAEASSDGRVKGLEVTLGVEVDPGQGEGPIVTRVNGQARSSGIRPRDVITAINGRPTRDMNDFVRVLSAYRALEKVELSVRRRAAHLTLEAMVVGK